jgi:uncharacterized membrane protein YcaP (DUF421 family)
MINPYIQIIINCVCVYGLLLLAFRVFGKRELSQLNTIDIILILLISNAVQNAMVDVAYPNKGDRYFSLAGGLLAAFVLFTINFILKKTFFKSKIVADFFLGKPEILIHNGIVDFKSLSRFQISSDELHEVIREHGVSSYKDVKLAMMEIDGNISIISGDKTLKQTHHKRKIHKTLGTINI